MRSLQSICINPLTTSIRCGIASHRFLASAITLSVPSHHENRFRSFSNYMNVIPIATCFLISPICLPLLPPSNAPFTFFQHYVSHILLAHHRLHRITLSLLPPHHHLAIQRQWQHIFLVVTSHRRQHAMSIPTFRTHATKRLWTRAGMQRLFVATFQRSFSITVSRSAIARSRDPTPSNLPRDHA